MGHTKIYDGLVDEHLAKGWMDSDMAVAYLIMLRQCNWSTGVWRGCAEKLVRAMGNQWSESKAHRILRRLELGRYIARKMKSGVHGNYDVEINNFIPTSGPNKDKKIRRTKTIHWKDASPSSVTPNSVSPVTDPPSPMTTNGVTHDGDSVSPVTTIPDVSFSSRLTNPDLTSSDRSINQPTKKADASPETFEEENPPESGVAPARKTQTQEELEVYFPRCPATPENLAMLDEINAALGDFELADVLSFNWEHQQGKLRLHSLAQTHRAVVHGDPENGILVQFKYHVADDCRTCVRKKKEHAKNAPPTTSLHPKVPGQSIPRPKFGPDDVWGFKPSGDGGWNRCLQRRPRTAAERRELIALRGTLGSNGKPIRWENIASYLAQDNCKQCNGTGSCMEPTKFARSKKFVECPCVLMEEILRAGEDD